MSFSSCPFLGGINRTMILTILAALLVVWFFWAAFRKRSLVPGKLQTLGETALSFVRDEIAVGIIGPEHGLKYFPYLASIFFFILVGNLMEVFPLTTFPIASRIGLPAFLAIITWILFIVAGIKAQGFGGYFGHLVWPPGVPVVLKPLVGAIELVSTLLVRPFSLAVRLFANMAAGHVMLSLLLLSAWVFLGSLPTGNLQRCHGACSGPHWDCSSTCSRFSWPYSRPTSSHCSQLSTFRPRLRSKPIEMGTPTQVVGPLASSHTRPTGT